MELVPIPSQVSVFPGASETCMLHSVFYKTGGNMLLRGGTCTNSCSTTFRRNMSLDTFFRNGPLVIVIMVTTETSQMKLDRPKTSVQQSS